MSLVNDRGRRPERVGQRGILNRSHCPFDKASQTLLNERSCQWKNGYDPLARAYTRGVPSDAEIQNTNEAVD
jgi:hypothetical protein